MFLSDAEQKLNLWEGRTQPYLGSILNLIWDDSSGEAEDKDSGCHGSDMSSVVNGHQGTGVWADDDSIFMEE